MSTKMKVPRVKEIALPGNGTLFPVSILIIFMLTVSGCAGLLPFRDFPDPARDPSDEPVRVTVFEDHPGDEPDGRSADRKDAEPLPGLAFRLDTTREELEQRLGKPVKIETEKVPNEHHPDIIDTIYTYEYRDIAFTIYHAGFDGREFLVLTTITGPSYATPQGITVGASHEDLFRAFGEPGMRKDLKIIFTLTPGGGGMVRTVYIFTFPTSSFEQVEQIEMALEIF